MSRKIEEKSAEEIITESLVPEDEQPYDIPENWKWTKLGASFEVANEKWEPSKEDNKIYIGLEDMIKGGGISSTGTTENVKSTKTVFKSGYVLYGKLRPYLNKHSMVNFDGVCSTDILVLRGNELFASKLFDKFLSLPQVIEYASNNSQGINLPRVSPSTFLNMPLPLPPIPEQKRIVDKLESMLGKINEARELIEQAQETFKERKSTILSKALRGELTAKWRDENTSIAKENLIQNVIFEKNQVSKKNSYQIGQINEPYTIPDSWQWFKLDDVCGKITDGTHHSPKSFDKGQYMYVTAKNIKEKGLLLDNITYVDEKVHREIYNRCDVKYEDVLYIKDGATTGIATVNTLEKEFSLLSSVGVLRPLKKTLLPKYLAFNLNSPETKNRMLSEIAGIAITRLTLIKIKNSVIPIPPLEEQKEIVRIVEHLLSLENEAKELIDNMEDELNLLEKSILSKAFRGELGTNNPEENSPLTPLLKSEGDKEGEQLELSLTS
jgi:type I restriction enzyme S subunit